MTLISFGITLWSSEMNLFMLQTWFYEMNSLLNSCRYILLVIVYESILVIYYLEPCYILLGTVHILLVTVHGLPRPASQGSFGQPAMATASQPRPASQGTCGQPAKAMASQPRQRPAKAKGRRKLAATFFFQNDKTITFKTLKGKTVTLGTNTCI